MSDKRSTDERAKRSDIKIERTGPRTEPCGTSHVRGDEGELCGGIPTVDVRGERYEVNSIVVKQRNAEPGEKTME